MTEHSTKIYLWPSSVLNTFVKRTPGVVQEWKCFVVLTISRSFCEMLYYSDCVSGGGECRRSLSGIGPNYRLHLLEEEAKFRAQTSVSYHWRGKQWQKSLTLAFLDHFALQTFIMHLASYSNISVWDLVGQDVYYDVPMEFCQWLTAWVLVNHIVFNIVLGGPVAEWLRTLFFSALNRSSSHHCGIEPISGHMWDKPRSPCVCSGGFSQGSPVFIPPYD